MTIPALTDATRSTPPTRKKTWATFLTESLEQSWREDEWDPNEYEFTGMLNSAQTGLSVCLRDGCETVVDHGVELCSACTKAKRNLPPGAQLQPRKLNHRRRQNPKSAARFSLASLGPVVRDEILYGLQDRDRRQLAIRPFHVRQLIKKIPVSTGSLLELSDSDYSGMQGPCSDHFSNQSAVSTCYTEETMALKGTCGIAPWWAFFPNGNTLIVPSRATWTSVSSGRFGSGNSPRTC